MGIGDTIKNRTAWGIPWALILGLMGFIGCKEARYAPESKFVDLYVELKLATVVFASDMDKVNETRRAILQQHGMKPSDFHDHYVRLMAHPEAWRKFQEQVIKKVDEFQVSRKGDTANGI